MLFRSLPLMASVVHARIYMYIIWLYQQASTGLTYCDESGARTKTPTDSAELRENCYLSADPRVAGELNKPQRGKCIHRCPRRPGPCDLRGNQMHNRHKLHSTHDRQRIRPCSAARQQRAIWLCAKVETQDAHLVTNATHNIQDATRSRQTAHSFRSKLLGATRAHRHTCPSVPSFFMTSAPA